MWENKLKKNTATNKVTAYPPTSSTGQYACLEGWPELQTRDSTRMRMVLATGRSHQIRAQSAFHGHPVIGDTKYGGSGAERMLLHAWQITFPHPMTTEIITITAPLPEDFLTFERSQCFKPSKDD